MVGGAGGMIGLVTLQEEERNQHSLSTMGGHKKKAAVHKAGQRFSPGAESESTFLGLSSLQNSEK